MFPDGAREGLYHTADATLWFFHAVDRYVRVTGDRETLRQLLPTLRRHRRRHHLQGTRFGIGVDPADGLLTQGSRGLSAHLDGCEGRRLGRTPAPRQGGGDQRALVQRAASAATAGSASSACDDAASISRAHAQRAQRVLQRALLVRRRRAICSMSSTASTATIRPAGRTRSSRSRSTIRCSTSARWAAGDGGRARAAADAGRVCARWRPGIPTTSRSTTATCARAMRRIIRAPCGRWLIGPYVDAWLKVHPDDRAGARQLLEGFEAHLSEACVGSISEIFDAEEPYTAARLRRAGMERRGSAALPGRRLARLLDVTAIGRPFCIVVCTRREQPLVMALDARRTRLERAARGAFAPHAADRRWSRRVSSSSTRTSTAS